MAKKYIPYSPYRPNGTNKQRFVEPLANEQEIKKVLNYLHSQKNKRNYCMFCMLYGFGMRITDVLNMTWDWVLNPDLSIKDIVWLQESKKHRIRQLAMNNLIRNAITLYKEELESNHISIILGNYMFPSQKGYNKPMLQSNASRLFKKIFSDAHCDPQYNYCSHTPRKTAGKMLYEHGMKVWEVSKFLGHTDAQQTLCYIGITNKKVKDMHNILSAILA